MLQVESLGLDELLSPVVDGPDDGLHLLHGLLYLLLVLLEERVDDALVNHVRPVHLRRKEAPTEETNLKCIVGIENET